MNQLTIEINALKEQLINLNPESKLTGTITAESTGELMDSANDLNFKLIHPFSDSAAQSWYYFSVPVKKYITIVVKSGTKKEI